MAKHNLLKKISLSIASLALICPLAMSGFNTNANASSRYYFNNVRHPHNFVERAFTRKGWTSGPMYDFTGAHITIHGRHYTVHGTSAVGGYLTLNGSKHHTRRTHRVYRHHRRAKKTTRRRTKRIKKARKSHRRVARKAIRRPHIIKAHKARRTHKYHINNDSLLAAYEREAEAENTPTPVTPVHHESQAQWYKNNALRLYNQNFYTNHMFREGVNYGNSGTIQDSLDTTSNDNPNLRKQYIHNNDFKDGWILSYASQNINAEYNDTFNRNTIKLATVKDYQHALTCWNDGVKYVTYVDPNPSHLAVNYSNQWTTNP